MVKHTQKICNLLTNCLSVFDHFVGLALKGLIGLLSLRVIDKTIKGTLMQIWKSRYMFVFI